MIFRSNAGLIAIIFLELIFALALTRFAIDLPSSSQPSYNTLKPSAPKESAPDDYILLVATNYRNDRDLDLARERLALFQDDDIATRVSKLAAAYGSQNKNQANDLASLALALGAPDQSLSTLTASDGVPAIGSAPASTPIIQPTLVAFSIASPTAVRTNTPTKIPPTVTRKPTATSTRTWTPLPSATRTATASPSVPATLAPSTATSTPTPSPTPTLAPTSNSSSSANTTWQPDRSQWPSGAGLQSAGGAVGQPYWHLVNALYCDYTEERYDCPSRAGGPAGWGTYVMLLNSQGGRAEAPLLFNGAASGLEQKSTSDVCLCNYSFSDSGVNILVGGAASDSIAGLDPLYSVKFGLSHYHVRYFLTFQLLTK